MSVQVYALGLTACSVCAPAEMPVEEVTKLVNKQEPTGIDSPWQPDPAPAFRTGQSNPSPCERDSGRLHYLFNC